MACGKNECTTIATPGDCVDLNTNLFGLVLVS